MTKYIYNYKDLIDKNNFGGKAANLAQLSKNNFKVPDWLVISPQAFYDSLDAKQKQIVLNAKSASDVLHIFNNFKITESIATKIEIAINQTFKSNELVAVRSSAPYEDSENHSFAGQLESYLCVSRTKIIEKIIEVFKSGFSERIYEYIKEQKLPFIPKAPAVIIQKMVTAIASGISFSVDPVSGNSKVAVITATLGYGTAIVSGEVNADTFHIDKKNRILKSKIGKKDILHSFDKDKTEGLIVEDIPLQKSKLASISNKQIIQLAKLVRNSENYFGKPQDMEWAIDIKNKVYVLQSRPITNINNSKSEKVLIWDNSNISESYTGITTPLTFSFVQRAYEEVYKQFCYLMRVPKSKIENNKQIFANMLGFIQGRIYYNLINWYLVLSLLPGFKMNKKFMEQMMGVKEELENDRLEVKESTFWEKFSDSLNFIKSIFGILLSYFSLDKKKINFYANLEKVLNKKSPDLSQLSSDELFEYFQELETKILSRWDAPIINDFFAMIFFGLLSKLSNKWLKNISSTIHNDLIANEGGMISSAPAILITKLASIAKNDSQFIEILCQENAIKIKDALENIPEFKKCYFEYLEKYGDRCTNELKLESLSLEENPLILFRTIGQMAKSQFNKNEANPEKTFRVKAEDDIKKTFRLHPLRRIMFYFVLNRARKYIKDRENLRFERTRVFARARQIFREFGNKFYNAKIIGKPSDIFYLQTNEIFGFINGTTCTPNLKKLIKTRKEIEEEYKKKESPPDRFETKGIVHINQFIKTKNALKNSSNTMNGLGCCPGIIKGQVQIVINPQTTEVKPGKIIVARATDPSWIMVFPLMKGLLVEKGSLLSHSAIVARELNIPAIVSIEGILDWVNDGDWLEFDGRTGIINKINP